MAEGGSTKLLNVLEDLAKPSDGPGKNTEIEIVKNQLEMME